MPVEDAIQKRIESLFLDGMKLRGGPRGYEDEDGYPIQGDEAKALHYQDCSAYLAAVHNVLDKISEGTKGYMQVAERIFEANAQEGKADEVGVGKIAEMLCHIQTEIESGLLTSLADRARAETFDTFLDHGKDYLERGSIREAGVIVGVVFEDTVRRYCRKLNITEKGMELDQLISALAKVSALTAIKAKRARAAAAVRTSATHARWEEFGEHDVRAAAGITEELISALDG